MSSIKFFEQNNAIYEKALNNSGHNCNAKYQEVTNTRKRNRSRKIIYYNSPYSKSVKTNMIKVLLNLIEKH